MSCQDYQRDLLLHADGELESRASLDLLAHLRGCDTCAAKVYAQQQLKATISRVMGEMKAPTELSASISGLLDSSAAADVAPPLRIEKPARFGFRWPVAIAAMIALAGGMLWERQNGRTAPAVASVHAVPVTDDGPVAVELAKNVHKLHIRCAVMGAEHQDPAISRTAHGAADQLSATLGIPVLSGEGMQLTSGKAKFDSARLCMLPDATGIDHRVAHIMYRDYAGEAISLFTMATFDQIGGLKTKSIGGHDYAILEPGASTKCHPFTIVAWSGNGGGYMICSPFDYDATMASVEPLRVALDTGGTIPPLWLSSADSMTLRSVQNQ